MNIARKSWRNVVVIISLLTLITLLPAPTVMAGNPKVDAFPPNSRPYGVTYGEWSAKWWQYVYELPIEHHPLTDATGEYCGQGQKGPVFFLMGTTGGPITRTCAVPFGKALLIPIINGAGAVPDDGVTIKDVRRFYTSVIDQVDVGKKTLWVEIDGAALRGQALKNFRFPSPIFSFNGAIPNVYSGDAHLYEGKRQQAFADGYWIMLPPLSVGDHKIHFHGEVSSLSFEVDVEYNITVTPPAHAMGNTDQSNLKAAGVSIYLPLVEH